MNVNVCYDRYEKKSSIETGNNTNNQKLLRTNSTTKNNIFEKNEKQSKVCDVLRSSPIKGPSVRSKSDLNSSNLKRMSRGSSNDEMAVNITLPSSRTKTLPRSSSHIPLISSRPKTNIRSKSDLWSVKKSCMPSMATVTESVVSNGTMSKNTNTPSRINSSSNNNNANSMVQNKPPKSTVVKSSKIPVSPSFQRKLKQNGANNLLQESKSKIQFTSQTKAYEKPINCTQSSCMIQSKPDQKQSSYRNKERS